MFLNEFQEGVLLLVITLAITISIVPGHLKEKDIINTYLESNEYLESQNYLNELFTTYQENVKQEMVNNKIVDEYFSYKEKYSSNEKDIILKSGKTAEIRALDFLATNKDTYYFTYLDRLDNHKNLLDLNIEEITTTRDKVEKVLSYNNSQLSEEQNFFNSRMVDYYCISTKKDHWLKKISPFTFCRTQPDTMIIYEGFDKRDVEMPFNVVINDNNISINIFDENIITIPTDDEEIYLPLYDQSIVGSAEATNFSTNYIYGFVGRSKVEIPDEFVVNLQKGELFKNFRITNNTDDDITITRDKDNFIIIRN